MTTKKTAVKAEAQCQAADVPCREVCGTVDRRASYMKFYEEARAVPQEAQRTIRAGKLKGFTDINPMWRIKKLTEMFGPAGFGWYTEIADRWTEAVGDQITVQVRINLYVFLEGQWSKPIEGVGGSMLYGKGVGDGIISDEAYKMAYTDAISVACKSLGMAADIYFAKDRTKYVQAEDAAVLSGEKERRMETLKKVATLQELNDWWAGIVRDIQDRDLKRELREEAERKAEQIREGGEA